MFVETLAGPERTTAFPFATCAHCGQPVLSIVPGQDHRFCCSGCASVYAILKACRLDDYYRYRETAGAVGAPAKTSKRTYADLDEPEFIAIHCRALGDGRLGTELFLENVHCASCVWLIEKAPAALPGVSEARLDVSRDVVRLVWDPAEVELSRIAAWLDSIGYPSHPLQGLDRDAVRRREDRALLMRIGVAGAAAGNAMLLAIALYCGTSSGMDPGQAELFRWGSMVVALPSIFWSASVFYRGALGALRTLTPHMDLPISVAIVVGSVSGVVNTFRSHGDLYFDTMTMLVFLLLVGRFLQHRQQRKAASAEDALNALSPSTAWLLDGGLVREVPVAALPRGSLVEVRSGDLVPVDGTVVEGASSVDVSLLTGESLPADVAVGDAVHAGSVNVSSRLLVRAEKTGRETRLARLVARVAEAAERRAPIVLLANRFSGYFVMVVLVTAALVVVTLWSKSPALAVERAVALLVIMCPCALALATPLAVTAALGRAARRGLMIKGGQFLEALARPGLVVFDKTGTLTEGRLALVEFVGDESVKPMAAAAESGSAHPIARALRTAFQAETLPVADFMRETLGGGVEALVAGKRVVIGSAPFVVEHAPSIPAWVQDRTERLAARSLTPVLFAIDGEVRAVAGIGDPVRPDARESLTKLREMGYRLAVLSGDQPAVVHAVTASVGVPFDEVVGAASPEAKLAFIEERARRGPVFMVGDGVNDAAALSAATVGIAVHGGAEASLAAADVFATTAGLAPLVELLEGARRTLRVVRTNLARSLVYNVTVGTLAVLGFAGPLLAAVLMPASSIGLIASSYRARTFGARP